MAKQAINLGSPPAGTDGDTSRVAFIKTNANFDELYLAALTYAAKDISGGAADILLTESEAKGAILNFSGVLTAARNVVIPAGLTKSMIVRNTTTGGFSITVKVAGGAGVAVKPGYSLLLFSEGSAMLDPVGILIDDKVSTLQASITALQASVTAAQASLSAMVGSIDDFARNTAPAGYLKANGACVLVSAYGALTTAIYCGDAANATALFGYRCDNVDGSGRNIAGQYLRLPDLRGEFRRGWDDGRGIDTGRVFGSAQGFLVESHNHQYGASAAVGAPGGNAFLVTGAQFGTTSFGGSETRPRNIALLACIKYI